MVAFFWYYSGIEINGIDGIRVLLGHILFSEYSVDSAPDSGMTGIWFTPNGQNSDVSRDVTYCY